MVRKKTSESSKSCCCCSTNEYHSLIRSGPCSSTLAAPIRSIRSTVRCFRYRRHSTCCDSVESAWVAMKMEPVLGTWMRGVMRKVPSVALCRATGSLPVTIDGVWVAASRFVHWSHHFHWFHFVHNHDTAILIHRL